MAICEHAVYATAVAVGTWLFAGAFDLALATRNTTFGTGQPWDPRSK